MTTQSNEELAREFCKNTPLIKKESGMAFYKRLLTFISELRATERTALIEEMGSDRNRVKLAKFVMEKYEGVSKTGHFWFDEQDAQDFFLSLESGNEETK